MIYKQTPPHRLLLPFIRGYYLCHSDFNGVESHMFPSDGGSEIIIVLKNFIHLGFNAGSLTKITGAKLLGPYNQSMHTTTDMENTVVGVRFYPGAISAFIPVISHEITENIIDLSDLWGSEAFKMEENLYHARSFEEMTAILDTILLNQLSEKKILHHTIENAMQLIKSSKGQLPISDITDDLSVHPRQLQRLFLSYTGLTPKRICRIERFISLIEHFTIYPHHDWADIALDWGFTDQAHLIKDFNFFTGTSPEKSFKTFSDVAILQSKFSLI